MRENYTYMINKIQTENLNNMTFDLSRKIKN